MSAVWPVVDADHRPLALKICVPGMAARAEPVALAAWAGRGTVRLERHDPSTGAMLLARLDHRRSLQAFPDVDEACGIIGDIVAQLFAVPPDHGLPLMRDEVSRIRRSIQVSQRDYPDLLPSRLVDRALSTLHDLSAELAGLDDPVVVHGDCHFLNVLHTLPAEPPAWVAIDPLPLVGVGEWDLVPLLRNRWDDAEATGNPDAALRRRVDIVTERAGLARPLARAIAQAAAVDNLLSKVPDEPDHMFVAPYQVMSAWR